MYFIAENEIKYTLTPTYENHSSKIWDKIFTQYILLQTIYTGL